MKAVFLDFATMGPGIDISSLRKPLPELQFFDVSSDDEIPVRIAGAEFVLLNKARLTRELIEANPELQFVGLTATGTNCVDLDAAKERGIAVCNIRDYCTQSVSEHVLGCLLNLTHNLHRYNAAVRAGEWQKSPDFCLLDFPIRELSSMTLGIVGYGALGQGVATAAKALGMDILISARPGAGSVSDGRVAFDEVLQTSDVISLHCPLTASTQNLFGAAQFEKMKSDAILINTARGGLIDSAALVAALHNGDIGAAALDVLPTEPPVDGDPLLDYDKPNLMMTPHVAWASQEARQAAIDQLAACVTAFLGGKQQNRVV